MSSPDSLHDHLQAILGPIAYEQRSALCTSVLPTLLASLADVGKALRSSHAVVAVGSTNVFGDAQLNVDVAAEQLVRVALARCPSVVAASSEEDPVERPVEHTVRVPDHRREVYAAAFDPLDGSSIVGPGWAVGTIVGLWDGASALAGKPRERQVAAVLASYGSRNTALVALRVPGAASPAVCFEVGLGDDATVPVVVTRPDVRYLSGAKTRYFAPANLRAASEASAYMALVTHYVAERYTLRYSGGLVPDVAHALSKGHGVYVSPVAEGSRAKLRRLFELCPVAMVVECAGGAAVDAETGQDVLARPVEDINETGGFVCGNKDEVEFAMQRLLA
ncbi:sedoheptulose-1,7-bisphosphatase [Cordyceps fumosorosea ARSEF 2679]|uniref:Sedoheptulose-1,7-bisphosphatase n=1 Tax=Cordyceps fumosorosea (strain ARSEF 2679) TaxID=1081104 RepID=A0A162LJV9_CORFA|nr:sedoheptulose-1,7-bisphosphatase [Cordyceps fumosorosea ARSEF 2679]OAA71604.1 sedoheptulose-1,7-bisphosphatase [Cordyceps fumosorosea ARSEF 2679]